MVTCRNRERYYSEQPLVILQEELTRASLSAYTIRSLQSQLTALLCCK